MARKCKHRRKSWTGNTLVVLDFKGQLIPDSAKLIFRCCKCGKETTDRL